MIEVTYPIGDSLYTVTSSYFRSDPESYDVEIDQRVEIDDGERTRTTDLATFYRDYSIEEDVSIEAAMVKVEEDCVEKWEDTLRNSLEDFSAEDSQWFRRPLGEAF